MCSARCGTVKPAFLAGTSCIELLLYVNYEIDCIELLPQVSYEIDVSHMTDIESANHPVVPHIVDTGEPCGQHEGRMLGMTGQSVRLAGEREEKHRSMMPTGSRAEEKLETRRALLQLRSEMDELHAEREAPSVRIAV